MNTNTNVSAAVILSTMSAETQAALEAHFSKKTETRLLTELRESATGLLAKLVPAAPTPAPKAKKTVAKKVSKKDKDEPKAKREIHLVKLPDGRSGSDWIRDFDKANPGLKPSEVVKHFKVAYPEFDIAESLVSNVRSNMKRKAAEAIENVKKATDSSGDKAAE